MIVALMKEQKIILVTFFVCAWIFSGVVGCTVAPHSQIGRSASEDRQSKTRESPIPLQTTRENDGHRCEAKYYFGERRLGQDEGYSSYCYKLQSKLIRAARDSNLVEIRDALKYGANPNLPVDDSFPPLQTAATSGHAEAVRLLLDNGAQVNQVSDFENTPLNAAASYGHTDVVKVLLERGADACYRAAAGTAGDIARSRGFKELGELLKSVETEKCK